MFGYLNNVLVGTINANIFSSAFVTINGLSLGVVDRLIFDANLGGGF